jgi:hypothetical protein
MLTRYSNVELADCTEREVHKSGGASIAGGSSGPFRAALNTAISPAIMAVRSANPPAQRDCQWSKDNRLDMDQHPTLGPLQRASGQPGRQ